MSRIGNKLITLAEGVVVEVKEGNFVVVKGPKGELSRQLAPQMEIKVEGQTVTVVRPNDSILNKTLHGTTRANLNNMVEGVTNGFAKKLLIDGVGYRASLSGNTLVIAAGYSHLVNLAIPAGLTVTVPTPNEINIAGIDKQLVGQFASEVRAVRKPEPYKGKGIRYSDEIIRRKEGKKAK